jgi:aspartyl-tRNA(Asn)/glutamyl-tRNA(Gln) amidotransferase subunit A
LADGLTRLTAADLRRGLDAREFSAVEVAQAYLDRIAAEDGRYGCFLTVCGERALADARAAQERLDLGEAASLTGIPVAVKDIVSTSGVRTTCGSRILENYVPPFESSATQRLRDAGAVLLGKTNLDEFAMGASTETSAFQTTRNPWDPDRSPGGSSGGSAAAVSAELAPVALGTDTGGSIRQPASLCGVVGFKPTYGRVSRYGLVAFASSLDQIGPMARTVEDAALLAEAVSGHDPRDSTSLRMPPISSSGLKSGNLKGARLALPKELWGSSNDPGVLEQCEAALDLLKSGGAEVGEVSLPSIAYGVTTYYIIAPAEASSNLARFDGIRFGPSESGKGHIEAVEATRGKLFGHEVKCRIMIGTYALSAGYYDAYYVKAQQVRAVMRHEFERTFQEYDFIVSPTSPVPAFKIGELSADPLALKLLDYCTIPANMGGFPAISINCGFTRGLPVGFQLVGPVLADEKVLQAAYCAERAFGASARPPLP